jgi:hypothetical protein
VLRAECRVAQYRCAAQSAASGVAIAVVEDEKGKEPRYVGCMLARGQAAIGWARIDNGCRKQKVLAFAINLGASKTGGRFLFVLLWPATKRPSAAIAFKIRRGFGRYFVRSQGRSDAGAVSC